MKREDKVKRIVIVGSPNVGKSVLFNQLTGRYATVSNYPGTTVEISRGRMRIDSEEFEVVDTPGMYSLNPITEEERISRMIILNESPDITIHIVDAKNLDRMLPLTLQLIELEIPVILVLNMMDEAETAGISFDVKGLESELGIPVVPMIALTGRGLNLLKTAILSSSNSKNTKKIKYDNIIEEAVEKLQNRLIGDYFISKRSLALFLLQDDDYIAELVKNKEGKNLDEERKIVEDLRRKYFHSLSYEIAIRRKQVSDKVVNNVIIQSRKNEKGISEILNHLTMNLLTGIPILSLVLYYGLYKFVGVFAAGTVVDFIEATIFGRYINPFAENLFNKIPWKILSDLFVGEYGIITLGIRYAVAIVLPIVGAFSLVFALIEDSGYLPRLAMLIDRIFKKIGLSGRAVIPMVLGLGCDTMATVVTRTLPTVRERIISNLLLALAVPCSAQLGVIFALLSNNAKGLMIWGLIVVLSFLLIGFLSSKVLAGEKPIFFMEIPPLRLPKPSNVFMKTYARMSWYFKEVLPLFVFASVLIWVGQITGIFDLTIKALSYPVKMLGLPTQASVAFLFGFFRRDYGVAGLFDLNKSGLLTGNQLVVSTVTITLFLPCIAQFLVTIKERGFKVGFGISLFILFFAFTLGFLLNSLMNYFRFTI